jgi:RimJ/RimL family protein N-acetyltransferase
MNLLPLDQTTIRLAADWLAQRDNHKWLDFGHGVRFLTAPLLTLMNKHDLHLLRLYTPDESETPIGIIGLSDITTLRESATLWYVLGDKRFGGRSHTSRAVARMLTLGFRDLGLKVVHAWAVEANAPSVKVLERNGFKLVGRLRQCHEIDGALYDRLLFDMLRSEHVQPPEGSNPGPRAASGDRQATSAVARGDVSART